MIIAGGGSRVGIVLVRSACTVVNQLYKMKDIQIEVENFLVEE